MMADIHVTDPGIDEKRLVVLFTSVFNQYHQQLHRIAFTVTKSGMQAGDIVQDVFVKLWEHRNELPTLLNAEAWLHRVLRNKLVDFLRKAAADERLRAAVWTSLSQAADNPYQALEAREAVKILQKAVQELPEQRQLVYRLNRESGLSYQEIAEELSISKHTVKNQISLALRFLQKKLSFG